MGCEFSLVWEEIANVGCQVSTSEQHLGNECIYIPEIKHSISTADMIQPLGYTRNAPPAVIEQDAAGMCPATVAHV